MDDNTDHRKRSKAPNEPIQSRFEWKPTESPCTAIVEAVAASTGRDSADLPSLYATVDPDALTAVLIDKPDRSESAVRVSFEYAGVDVTVDSRGGGVVDSKAARRE
ncbi:HalOD1 output domain-containing protein [Haloarcula nitratireducens]|uniref:Halobacterial output domain-containing protein n=1 Tax=Haloarcula nitratireducens TaxID=2487749 RepID=A0AAW4PGB9_9EURY|nr:HalOD1 output domain-containing protein [Halomicroarcula nitratireducens]MBX0297137.1 hypothetical protein [Halomicroarcula nitratireducens]